MLYEDVVLKLLANLIQKLKDVTIDMLEDLLGDLTIVVAQLYDLIQSILLGQQKVSRRDSLPLSLPITLARSSHILHLEDLLHLAHTIKAPQVPQILTDLNVLLGD